MTPNRKTLRYDRGWRESEAWGQALADPDISQLWQAAVDVQYRLQALPGHDDASSPRACGESLLQRIFHSLLQLLTERAPTLAQAFGPDLPALVIARLLYASGNQDWRLVAPSPLYKEGYPRPTRSTQRRMDELEEVVQVFHLDPEIRVAWAHTMTRLAARHGIPTGLTDPTTAPSLEAVRDRIGDDLEDSLGHLEATVRRNAPDLANLWGPEMRRWLLTLCYEGIGLEIAEGQMPRATAKLWPNDPFPAPPWEFVEKFLEAFETGRARRQDLERWVHAFRDYVLSLLDARPRGRPKRVKTPGPKGRQRIDPQMARRAYAMREEGVPHREIARRLYPGASVAECSSHAMWMRIDRLLDRGQTLTFESPNNLHDPK
jgi:hypothetical protein